MNHSFNHNLKSTERLRRGYSRYYLKDQTKINQTCRQWNESPFGCPTTEDKKFNS